MLADQVRQARERAGLSTYTLAKKSGIGVATIADIESGRTTNPGIVTMRKLADALHSSLDDLAERSLTSASRLRPRRPRQAAAGAEDTG